VRSDQAKRLKELEKENARLKKVVADLTLDNAILKEAACPNF
jgi:putative transposase